MRTDSTTMSAMSHQPREGRRSSDVSQFMMKTTGRTPHEAPLLMSPYLLRSANDLNHLVNRMDADDVRAAEDRCRHGGRRRPVAVRRAALAARRSEKRLARRSDEKRPAERRGELGEPRQHTIAVRRTFG